ncbi:pyridoxine/pyridoxamine 5'-phosphate oxidase-like [Oppia nitens]|uniref:pyridoxine/pyridoxamine 5'-phosphate oxidase-like n=1 Tax=Oppia nitens TaxID=1686743 RepID=UPI0023DAACD6|nr:pyridoxine/pyridoxamine 5'-phosphate oxidase-like [Oppia nitens]
MSSISKKNVDLGAMRKPYSTKQQILLETQLESKNPLKLFDIWFDEIKKCGKIYEPNAVCLATSDKNGRPSARMVLLKAYGDQGFTIFTNYESRKGQEMIQNPNASLLFYWDVFNRQVRIEGRVEKVSEEESVQYFKSRPRASQLSARISQQSKPIDSRDKMVDIYNEEEIKYPNDIPKPHFWGGFTIVPEVYEFWMGQTDRLHDRIRFFKSDDNQKVDGIITKLGEDGWAYQRLQP